ncbi:hypothetical protein KIW84_041229 [Lathyrus oleraceus]|uniref:Pentatricopeptide repeat-containing protein n=1 Tax=Pisum sativum TaxID=3888 RepID=A0A9D4XCE7_PEA|nr:hypothetical protein KIW84_041229 [Pisum sativum]
MLWWNIHAWLGIPFVAATKSIDHHLAKFSSSSKFRDNNDGSRTGCFAENISSIFAFHAELTGAIRAAEIAHVHEDVEADATRSKDGGIDNHEHTLDEGISKKEGILMNIMVNDFSNNINNVVKNSDSVDKDVVLMNKDVHGRSELGNEGDAKDADLDAPWLGAMVVFTRLFDEMLECSLCPDIITYNTLLNGLCKAANSEEVMEIFKAMSEKGCAPNIITYNIIIESLCKSKKVIEAIEFLGEIINKNLGLPIQWPCAH